MDYALPPLWIRRVCFWLRYWQCEVFGHKGVMQDYQHQYCIRCGRSARGGYPL